MALDFGALPDEHYEPGVAEANRKPRSPSAARGRWRMKVSGRWVAVAAVATLVTSFGAAGSARPTTGSQGDEAASRRSAKALMFAADGMRPDRAVHFATVGSMPAVREMMSRGITGANGLLP
ncbi:MAG: hypothetical protein H0V60_08205, partial [Actinobacteria bacterium]|nr:hypothetical protein [Actinomycetota bacterium]